MSDVAIRIALEKRLLAMPGGLSKAQTAFENIPFTPDEDAPYQAITIMRAETQGPEMGGGFQQKLGLFQITLRYPQDAGPGEVETQADAIAAWFPKGLSLTQSGVTVIIDKPPYIMAGFADGDRWSVPVRVSYFSNITS